MDPDLATFAWAPLESEKPENKRVLEFKQVCGKHFASHLGQQWGKSCKVVALKTKFVMNF